MLQEKVSRRGIISGFAALAALAVAPETLVAVPLSEQDKIVDQLKKTGAITNRYFEIDGPIVLENMSDFTISGCTFIATSKFPKDEPFLKIGESVKGGNITNCVFRSNNFQSGKISFT
jgi:hypothetical protein